MLGTLLCLVSTSFAAQSYTRINKLFNGTPSGPYHSYRIPAVAVGYQGALFVFCEAHRTTASDWNTEVDLVYKKSTDHGVTWSSVVTLADASSTAGYGNPTAVYEPSWDAAHPQGRLHVFFNYHSAAETGLNTLVYGDLKIYYTYSDDSGTTWAAKQDLTSTLNPSSGLQLGYDNVGPGIGIRQTQANAGRLVIPALSRNFFSTNHGGSWSVEFAPLQSSGLPYNTNEAAVVETLDGLLLRNDRPKGAVFDNPDNQRRWISWGNLGGSGFPAFVPQDALLDPKCQASILRYNFNAPDRIIFLNSSSTANRCRMKVRISYDDGATWPRERWLYVGTPPNNYATVTDAMNAGMGGYSSMMKTADFHIAAAVEISEGGLSGYDDVNNPRSIDFHKFNLEWILNGQSEP